MVCIGKTDTTTEGEVALHAVPITARYFLRREHKRNAQGASIRRRGEKISVFSRR
jgi:hypothetical protein